MSRDASPFGDAHAGVSTAGRTRVTSDGKHLAVGSEVFRIKGVTYGGFAARDDGVRFPDPAQTESDFHAMAELGLNTVRVYELPPEELLDIAAAHDLRVIVGLDYHDWRMEREPGRAGRRRILEAGQRAVVEAMELCAGRPEVLAIAVGNEIPVDLVRFHGIDPVSATLSRLVEAVHAADPGMLATYVNYPTTEHLEVEGQDIVCFNVFLEEDPAFERYVRHLQVVSRHRPLIISEVGLGAAIHGEQAQSELLEAQLRILDEAGVAGATVYAWTDEWAVNDEPVEGWGFGITTADRTPKPALDAVARWAGRTIESLRPEWPRLSVVVCAYNEERTLAECLASLEACRYPDLEVIVCNDGSTDRTSEIAHGFSFKVLELPHGGLSRARNAGLEASTGQIVAYVDADAACHPDWPFYLALSLEEPDVAATGGPNLPHPNAGLVERAVAESPGSPMEVLTSYDRAEHIAGCNMAFRRERLMAIRGFEPVYTSAGDDVDVCWKLLDEGHEIGFAPAAQVIHHRRATIKGYLRQQRGYGRAEKLLSGPHRYRFNRLGQARWAGFVYGGSRLLPSLFRPVVYTGHMGSALFQPITYRRAESIGSRATAMVPLAVPLMVLGALLSPFSAWWLALPGVLGLLAIVYGAGVGAAVRLHHEEATPLRLRALVGLLHVLQPLVRAWGRVTGSTAGPPRPVPTWSGDRLAWLESVRRSLETERCGVRVSEPGANWDLEAVHGPMVSARITAAVAWQCEARHRITYGLRPTLWALAAGAIIFVLAGWTPDWPLAALLVVWPLGELAVLRRRVARSIGRAVHANQS